MSQLISSLTMSDALELLQQTANVVNSAGAAGPGVDVDISQNACTVVLSRLLTSYTTK